MSIREPIPCYDCITLSICIAKYNQCHNEHFLHSKFARYLSDKCSIMRVYIYGHFAIKASERIREACNQFYYLSNLSSHLDNNYEQKQQESKETNPQEINQTLPL